MKALVIGYGSIGKRHTKILDELNVEVYVVSSRNGVYARTYKCLSQALNEVIPDYIVIATKTSDHYDVLYQLAKLNFEGKVLVEKPLFSSSKSLPKNAFKSINVAYNLRYHPIIKKLNTLLIQEKVISVQAYVGQYLPSWRPDTDYRKSYSSLKNHGGGVLLDLSHELDYILQMCGPWDRVTALGGKFSSLEISSDDIFTILMETKKCPVVSIQLNYLDRKARREIVINTDNKTIKADIVNGTLEINKEVVERFQLNRDYTYMKQHLAVLEGNQDNLCSAENGLEVLKLIEAIENSVKKKAWIYSE